MLRLKLQPARGDIRNRQSLRLEGEEVHSNAFRHPKEGAKLSGTCSAQRGCYYRRYFAEDPDSM